MASSTPTRRSASHTQACDAAITFTPNSRSSVSMASITGQCGEGKKIESACGCARIGARLERGRHRDRAEIFDDLALSHSAQNTTALAFGVDDGVGHYHLPAGEHVCCLRLRGGAR